jgi:hypothetical protein
MNWYEQVIEEPIRNIVRILRNNGINTISSCGHRMWIECEVYDAEAELRKIYDALTEFGYYHYSAQVIDDISEMGRNRYIKIKINKNYGNITE